jgi:ATP-binding cassette subfamily C protein LapB
MDSPLHRYVWLRDALLPLKPRFSEILLQSFFINLLALAVPLFSLQVYDRVIGHQGLTTLAALCIGIVLALGFDFLLRQTRSQMLQSTAVHIDAHLGRWLYGRFSALPLATLESRPANYWRGLFQDAQMIRSVFSGSSAVLVADLPFALVFLIVIISIATPIAWVLMLMIPAFVFLTWYSTRSLGSAAAGENRKNQHHDSFIAELLAGRTTVKSLMLDRILTPQWESLHASAIEESHRQGIRTDQAIAYGQVLSTLTMILLISFGALAIIEQQMTMGALIATTMLSNRIIQPLTQIVAQWRGFARCRQAIHQLDGLMQLPQETYEAAITRPRPQGFLTLENLSFTHAGREQPALSECSLRLQPNEMVGLVGLNGCGKSTLLKLMQGLYKPNQGRVLLDDIDIAQLSRRELSEWIGYVPQECFLFSGTIRDNLTKAWPEADDGSIRAAVTIAGAEKFINDLPEGFNTQIGENGHRLSGGQRQRLAIARALLRNPPVLLMDEVTSNLDTDSEAQLRLQLTALTAGHTILLATHSVPILRACHRIIVMEKGRIIADGNSAEVLDKLTWKAA